MCFYDQYRYSCGDYKWGHFRQHCTHEHRTGETCGMKLILDTVHLLDECKICGKINTKLRKRAFEVGRVERWHRETGGHKRSASMEKSLEAIRCLDEEIFRLRKEVEGRRMVLGGRK